MDREGKHLLSHSAIYLVARGLPGIIAFSATALYTHLLEPAEYGRYALVLATANLINALLFQWLRLALVRYLPTYRDSPTAFKSTLITMSAGLTAVVGLVAVVIAAVPALHSWRNVLLPCWALLATQSLFELCCEFSRAALRPWEAMKLQVTRATTAVTVGTILILVGVRSLGPLAGLAIGYALAAGWAWRRDWGDVRLRIDRAALSKIAQYGVPLSITVALTIVIATSDRFLIAWRLGESAAGLYSVAVDFTSQTLTMPLMIIYMAAFPLAVRAWEDGGRDAAVRQMRMNASLLLALGVPAAIGLAVLAPGIARCFLGGPFRASAAAVIPLMALGTLIAGFKAYHFDAAFQFAHRTLHQVWIVLVAAALNVALNLIAIPLYGIKGSAGASVIAYGVSIALTIWFGRRHFTVPFPARTTVQVTLCGLVMGAVLYPLRTHVGVAALAMQVFIGVAVYGSAMVAMNVLNVRRSIAHWLLSTTKRRNPDEAPLKGSLVEGAGL